MINLPPNARNSRYSPLELLCSTCRNTHLVGTVIDLPRDRPAFTGSHGSKIEGELINIVLRSIESSLVANTTTCTCISPSPDVSYLPNHPLTFFHLTLWGCITGSHSTPGLRSRPGWAAASNSLCGSLGCLGYMPFPNQKRRQNPKARGYVLMIGSRFYVASQHD